MINVFEDTKADDGSVPRHGGKPMLEFIGLAGETAWGYIGYECLFSFFVLPG